MEQKRYTPEEEAEIREILDICSAEPYWHKFGSDLEKRMSDSISRILFEKFIKGKPEYHEHYVSIYEDATKHLPEYFTGADYPRYEYGKVSRTPEEFAASQGIPLDVAVKFFEAQENFQRDHNIGKRK